ncbi:MAG: NAD-dependent succinate-semialdehyde dehydrogenase, partial [Nitriliruptorales bacterium]|nr:NAD-dependent succinate-semialdehyde dehydrogenase [Nitriliruptorales bacterium]
EETFHDWRETSFERRGELLERVADLLDERQDELAELMVTEMGKPITGARSEVAKCAWVCRHYAENAERYLEQDHIDTDAETSYVRFDPLGPLFAIMPWNFPLWQVFRAAAPSIMAGNTVLLKHAANVPGCALAIEDLFAAADAPNGLFQTLMIHSPDAGEVIADARIRAVTLTGSVGAGRAVAEQAGANLKKTVLELGGSDAFIVLEDADLDHTVPLAVQSRLINNGESCIAAKRFIVVESILDDFLDRFTDEMRAVTVGDPMDPDTDVGPLAREDLRDDLHDQVRRTVDAAGAKLVTGGQPIDGPGFFYEPTVIAGVEAEMAGAQEETFGPAAVVMSAEHEEAAVALANASDFGLGASVWTSDLERGQRVAAQVDAGCLFVNQLVKSDPRVPFGGVKDSGYGRELGAYGIKEFVNAKTVWVEKPGG